jgi:hypothetical protein
MDELIKLLKMESEELVYSFKKASIQGEGTPQEVADFREGFFHDFIRRYFPFPHRVAKGIIRDSYGESSDSIDCIIINPNHPYTIDTKEKYSLILADGVDLVIEVKPDIANKNELIRGLKQIQSIKKLRRRESPEVLRSSKPDYILEYSKQIPAFIFSLKAKIDPLDTLKELKAFYDSNQIPIEEQVDFIIINDVGIISNYKYIEIGGSTTTEGKEITNYIFEEWRDLTLPAFLLKLNLVYHATPSMLGDIINYYLKSVKPYNLKYLNT